VPASVLAFVAGRRRIAAAAAVAALLNLGHVGALAIDPRPARALAAAPVHRALLLNSYYKSRSHAGVIQLIREKKPDVVVLVEVTPGLADTLVALADEYPYREAFPRPDAGGLAILSRQPLDSVHRYPFGSWKRAVLVARTRIGDRAVTVVGMHPYSSRGPERSRIRAFQMRAVGRWVAARKEPVLLLGDLNATPWSPVFGDLLRASGLRDARQGHGALPTYPAWFPPLWLPLDHGLVSREFTLRDFRVGPYAGSDHFPVVVDFSIGS
jgi:endonuclease/exonuclease/phosphatase (EEP) superfamily protein YafD